MVITDAGDAGRERREWPGIAIGTEEADELHDLDQRPGRRFRHAETVEHFAGREPVVGVDALLADVGEHRVGPAERDHRRLAEEQRLLRVRRCRGPANVHSAATGASQMVSQIDQRADCMSERSAARPRPFRRRSRARPPLRRPSATRALMTTNVSGQSLPPTKPIAAADQRRSAETAPERRRSPRTPRRRCSTITRFLSDRLPIRSDRFDDDGDHGRLQAVENAFDDRQIAVRSRRECSAAGC